MLFGGCVGDGVDVDAQHGGAGGQAAGPPAAGAGRGRGQERQLYGHLGHGPDTQDMGPQSLQVPARVSRKCLV